MLARLAHRPGARALAGTLLGSLPGLLLPFLITARVEAGRATDAYFYAFAIALFVSAVVNLALEANVLPVAAFHRRRGAGALRGFARGLLVRSVAATTAGYAVVGALGAGSVLLRDNWTADQQRLCIEIIAIFSVYLAAIAASSVLDGCLYAFGSFFVTTATIGVRSLLPLPFLLLAPAGATALLLGAGALAAGEVLRALFLARALRLRLAALGEPEAPVAVAEDPPSVWATALPYGLAMVVFGSFQLVDRVVASTLAPGSVTVLDLAEKLFYTPVTILMSSIMLVSGARWAATLADRPHELARDFAATVRRGALLSGAVAIAAIAVLVAVRLTVRATVAGVDLGQLAVVLAILMAGFPAVVVTNAGVRLLSVLRRTRVFPALAVVSLAADVAGAIVGARLLGIEGIAAAGTVWRTINLVCFLGLSATALRALPTRSGPFTGRAHPTPSPSITLEPSP